MRKPDSTLCLTRPFSHFRSPLPALSRIDKSRPSKTTKDLTVRKERVERAANSAKKGKAEEHGLLKEERVAANEEKAKEKLARTAGSFQTSSKATGPQLTRGDHTAGDQIQRKVVSLQNKDSGVTVACMVA